MTRRRRNGFGELGWETYAWLIYSLPFLFASFDSRLSAARDGRDAGRVRRCSCALYFAG